MWVVARQMLGDEIADMAPCIKVFGPYTEEGFAWSKLEDICGENRAYGELDQGEFENAIHVVKLRQ